MEYSLFTDLPELTEVEFLPGWRERTGGRLYKSLFLHVRIGRDEQEEYGTSKKHTRLLLVNIDRYVSEGRRIVADAFPHCMVMHLHTKAFENMNVSPDEQKMLRELAALYYLVIPLAPSLADKYRCTPCGAEYRVQSRYNEAFGTIRSGKIQGAVDIFLGGQAYCNQQEQSMDRWHMGNYAKNVYLHNRVDNGSFGARYHESLVNDVETAHFDAALEEVLGV